MSAPFAIEIVAAKSAAISRTEAAISAELAKKRQLASELDAAKDQRAELEDAEARDTGIRLLEGDDAAPVDKARAAEIAKLSKRIPGLAAALPLQDERIAALRKELAIHRQPLQAAAFDLINEIQEPAASSVSEGLAALAPALSELLAADIVRAATIGDAFAIPDGRVPPFGGRVVVETFLKAIPKRLRPPELDNDRLFAAARERAAEILNQINGKEG